MNGLQYSVSILALTTLLACKEEEKAEVNGVETVCSAEIVQRWSKRDEIGNPIWEDYIKIDMMVDFNAVDKKYNLAKDRPNYLLTSAAAIVTMKDGSEQSLVDSIAYGYKDGAFVPQQTFFEKPIAVDTLADGLPVKCFVGG